MKQKQCPLEREIKEEAVKQLFELESRDLIELYFGDESGFCNVPVVARAWQFRDEEIRITPQKSKRLNVFGFVKQSNESRRWTSEQAVGAQLVVDSKEEWVSERLDKPSVLVLDNARIHRSRLVQSKVLEWEEKNLYIFYLPAYAPPLNLIERLWRKMKYEWRKAEDYISFERLSKAVKEILREIGKKYRIKFRDRISTK